MKLLFVARAIDQMAGGLERMITTIMNALAPRHDVSLLTWDQAGATAFYPMAPNIAWHRLNLGNAAKRADPRVMLARRSAVRKLVREITPDVIVCFQGGSFMAMELYTAGLGIPLIAAERTAPTLYDHADNAATRFVEHQAFRFAKRITIQFERYRDLYPRYLRDRMVTIPNPVPVASEHAAPDVIGAGGRWRLLAVGRIGYQKNFGVLLEAFGALAGRFPDWDLRIVGEGPDRKTLSAQAAARPDLSARVSLPGATTDVEAEYRAAHLFCLPSRWEGFPNALAEALAHGLPAVGFDGCAGMPDLITAGRNGALAPGNGDAAALAEALAPLMAGADARAAMGKNAVASVAAYAPQAMFKLWEDTLRDAVRS